MTHPQAVEGSRNVVRCVDCLTSSASTGTKTCKTCCWNFLRIGFLLSYGSQAFFCPIFVVICFLIFQSGTNCTISSIFIRRVQQKFRGSLLGGWVRFWRGTPSPHPCQPSYVVCTWFHQNNPNDERSVRFWRESVRFYKKPVDLVVFPPLHSLSFMRKLRFGVRLSQGGVARRATR